MIEFCIDIQIALKTYNNVLQTKIIRQRRVSKVMLNAFKSTSLENIYSNAIPSYTNELKYIIQLISNLKSTKHSTICEYKNSNEDMNIPFNLLHKQF